MSRCSGVLSLREGRAMAGERGDDPELLDRCRRGDRAAFNQLVMPYYAGIYDVARRLLPCPDDAANVAQEVFVAAWKQLPRFRPGASLRTWLHAIARRQCAQSARAARRRPASLESLGEAPRAAGEAPVHALAERRERETALHAAIQALPPAQREAIVLHYFGDLTCDETAAVMGISAGSVKTHLFRGRARLRAALQDRVDEEGF